MLEFFEYQIRDRSITKSHSHLIEPPWDRHHQDTLIGEYPIKRDHHEESGIQELRYQIRYERCEPKSPYILTKSEEYEYIEVLRYEKCDE
jgi:hypothetical protein